MRWFDALKEKWFPSRHQHNDEADQQPLEYHPAHEGETPEDLHRGRHRIKETFTSHWDLDYLPRDELEKQLSKERDGNDKEK